MPTFDPFLDGPVSDQQRDRAVDYLQQAYATGALDPDAFDKRLGTALTTSSRVELNACLRGIPRSVPVAPPLAAAPVARPEAPHQVQDVGAGLTHLSGLFTAFVGPAVVKAVATPGGRAWLEASRALAFQLTMLIVGALAMVSAVVLDAGLALFAAWMTWFVGTILLSVRAFNGRNSTERVEKFLIVKPEHAHRQIGR